MNRKQIVMLAALMLLVMGLESIVVHDFFTSRVLGGNDFYPRWAGARALLVEGRDPYAPTVTEEIAAVLDPLQNQEVSFSFAYPLHTLLFMGPLGYLSYEWAIAIWMVLVQWAAVGTVGVLLFKQKWLPSAPGLAALMLAALAFYPVARSILLGQFTLHVALFLALSVVALRREAYGWAGIFLSATSIKPQMVILIGPWLLLWAIRKRAYRFIWGLLGGGLAMLLASMALFPRWPLSFLEDLQRYSAAAGGKEPLALLAGLLVPGGGAWLHYSLALLLLGGLLYAWWRGWHGEIDFDTVLYWSIVVNLLVPFQTGTTNQALLLIPFLGWLHAAQQRWNRWLVACGTLVLLVANWLFFLNTIEGNYESPLLFLPLPLLALIVLLAQRLKSVARPAARAATGETGS